MMALKTRLEKRGVSVVITGADGSGKTTLAKQLAAGLAEANLPCRHLHVYAWHANLLLVPFLILRNRYISRTILILDRSIYDNVAVIAAKFRRKVYPIVVTGLNTVYPRFDHAFYLYADRNEILRRRPETDLDWHDRLIDAYQQIVEVSGHSVMISDGKLYSRAVASLLEGMPNKP